MTWISFTEQHPPEYVGILVTNGQIVTCAKFCGMLPIKLGDADWPTFTGHGFSGYEWEFDFDERKITHWALLPEPPVISG